MFFFLVWFSGIQAYFVENKLFSMRIWTLTVIAIKKPIVFSPYFGYVLLFIYKYFIWRIFLLLDHTCVGQKVKIIAGNEIIINLVENYALK